MKDNEEFLGERFEKFTKNKQKLDRKDKAKAGKSKRRAERKQKQFRQENW